MSESSNLEAKRARLRALLEKQSVVRTYPLSFAQERMWFLEQLEPGHLAYHMPGAVHMRGRLDPELLRQSLERVVHRHEALRTQFRTVGEVPVQWVNAPAPLSLPRVSLEAMGSAEQTARIREMMAEEASRPFNLSQGPLIRGALVTLAPERSTLLLTIHHSVCDGWSIGLIARELGLAYDALLHKEPPKLPLLPLQYGDYARWQRDRMAGEPLQELVGYWQQRLSGAPALLELAPVERRGAHGTGAARRKAVTIPKEQVAALDALAREESASLFMAFLAAFDVLLWRWSGQTDIVVGTPVANRSRPELEPIVGLFVNTVAVRMQLLAQTSFRALLGEARRLLLEDYAHQELPFEKLVEVLRSKRHPGRSPVFQVMLAYQNTPSVPLALGTLELTLEEQVPATLPFDLLLDIRPDGEGMRLTFDYPVSLFDDAAIDGVLANFSKLLGELGRSPNATLEDVCGAAGIPAGVGVLRREELLQASTQRSRALTEEERTQVLAWGRGPVTQDPPRSITSAFEEQVRRTPDAVAVEFEQVRLTYRELLMRAEQLAVRLTREGVQHESRVGVLMERSAEMVVAVLGVLKAGAAYVPLDPALPRERIDFLVEDAGVRVLVVAPGQSERLAFQGARVVELGSEDVRVPEGERSNLAVPGLRSLAYVIYTSGSTGKPKGVLVEHGAVVNFVLGEVQAYGLSAGTRVLQFASLSFDISVEEIFLSLLSGGTVVLARREDLLPGPALESLLRERHIQLISVTPAVLNAWEPGELPELRTLISGGEFLSAETVKRWSAPGRRIFNSYGPTEATVAVTAGLCRVDGKVPSLGAPLGNAALYVLDAQGQLLPVGMEGELCIGGRGVARGYLGRPALTAERFVPDPFVEGDSAARMYRTGDRVRWSADGQLEFIGRDDDQVKIRGFRVELGEIEAALRAYPGLREVAVVAREDSPGDRRLVAYVSSQQSGEAPKGSEMAAFLRQSLPAHMVPSAFVVLGALPLSTQGKVLRSALPRPDSDQLVQGGDETPPSTPTGKQLAALWAALLSVPRVGARDNFFELGGHSLLAVRLQARVRDQLGVELPVKALFEAADLDAMAELVDQYRAMGRGGAPELPPIRALQSQTPGPLSFPQERLWLLQQVEPDSAAYNVGYSVKLQGALDVPALERALAKLAERHASLRTTFEVVDGKPVQRVHPPTRISVQRVELSAAPQQALSEALDRARATARRPFDIATGPLVRAELFRLGADEHLLVMVLHHIITDGWSNAILLKELGALYSSERDGRAISLPPLPVQYTDFSVWQRETLERRLGSALEYWRQTLRGAPALLELPTDHPRPAHRTQGGRTTFFEIPEPLTQSLRALSRREGVTLYMSLLAAFQLLMARYSGQEDVSVGSPVAGRGSPDVEGLVGFFLNMLVMRGDLSGDPTFRELLDRVRRMALGAFAHPELPFERLVEELQPQRSLSHAPLFQVMFVLQNTPVASGAMSGLEVTPVHLELDVAQYDLGLSVEETPRGLRCVAQYSTDLFDESTVQRMLSHWQRLLEELSRDVNQRVWRIPLITPSERRTLVEDWNRTQVPYRQHASVHALIEEQVERSPDAVALVFEDSSITYAELNARADQLAVRLRRVGVGPEVRVGVYLRRSVEMVVGILAIWKAGGAYVPLDPTYPADRIAYVAEDAGLRVVLTQTQLASAVRAEGRTLLLLDAPLQAVTAPASEPSPRAALPDNAAYVLYTSGSTGRPKGTVVCHRSVLNFMKGMDLRLGERGGVWLAVTSISFDISVLELFWTLTRGFKVVIQSEDRAVFASKGARSEASQRPIDFGLMYFASQSDSPPGREKYRLLIEGARFADQHGFSAIWTPERHFGAFGGLYPSPSVIAGALATATERIHIRAGSVVLPLHHPVRVAEEWALVDNLSGGRVGVSFATGWHADDFVLAPERFASRREFMAREIGTVRALWRGEAVTLPNGIGTPTEVRIQPRPVQSELPVWVTAAGNPDTFRTAGALGANVLTHLLGQSVEEVAEKVRIYREARRAAGFAGEGRVTLMLHTFVGEDDATVREAVRRPFSDYLRSSLELLRPVAKSMGLPDPATLTTDDLNVVIERAYDRYFETSGMFGTVERCLRQVDRLREAGVDEVACLIDFGMSTEEVLASLPLLDKVRARASETAKTEDYSLVTQLVRHGVTHLQVTPTLAEMLLLDPSAREPLSRLDRLMVGGEALPPKLASELAEAVGGEVHNMYGPTETTVWSTTWRVPRGSSAVSIGRPIANTQIHVLDRFFEPVPVGVTGELYIGGEGLARCYLHRPDLSADRFMPDPFSPDAGGRMYRTGDLARWLPTGELEFLGRADNQVKLRGHRIELGEIEAVLGANPSVRRAVVIAREDVPGDKRLVAYVVAHEGAVDTAALEALLRQRLPAYMVPSAIVPLEAMPLTPNGKVDRRALPPPGEVAGREQLYVAPRTPTEEALAEMWAQILGRERVGVEDDFFALGGNSLLGTQLIARMREAFQVDLPLRKLFETPTIAAFAQAIEDIILAEAEMSA